MKKAKKEKFTAKHIDVRKAAAAVCPNLTLECLDRYEILLGGCRKIVSYSETNAEVSTSSCLVRITGENITISFSGNGKILLCGKFSSIEFV